MAVPVDIGISVLGIRRYPTKRYYAGNRSLDSLREPEFDTNLATYPRNRVLLWKISYAPYGTEKRQHSGTTASSPGDTSISVIVLLGYPPRLVYRIH